MKILALSDEIVPFIYDGDVGKHFLGVDLVVSCGDLSARYLEFVLTALNVPLVYVPGNHDLDDLRVPGGRALDGKRKTVGGLRLLGMGGSQRYKPQGRHQYTQRQMARRMLGAYPRALLERALCGSGLDVLVTHSPPYGIHDSQDPAHIGFKTFRRFMRWGRPRYLLHGHQHVNRNLDPTETKYHGTIVINVYPYLVLDIPLTRSGTRLSVAGLKDG